MRKIVLLMLLVTAMPLFAQKSKKLASPASNELQQLIDSGADVRMPSFKDGDLQRFRNWVMKLVSYPDECLEAHIEGRVTIQFVVEKDGSIGRFEVIESPHRALTEEVMRALERSPRWKAGMIDGEPVAVSFNLPVDFRIPQPSTPRHKFAGEGSRHTNSYRQDVNPRNGFR